MVGSRRHLAFASGYNYTQSSLLLASTDYRTVRVVSDEIFGYRHCGYREGETCDTRTSRCRPMTNIHSARPPACRRFATLPQTFGLGRAGCTGRIVMKLRQAIKIQSRKHYLRYSREQLRQSRIACWRHAPWIMMRGQWIADRFQRVSDAAKCAAFGLWCFSRDLQGTEWVDPADWWK